MQAGRLDYFDVISLPASFAYGLFCSYGHNVDHIACFGSAIVTTTKVAVCACNYCVIDSPR